MNIFKRFFKNTKGVAALEFSLIAPILLAMMIGTMEASNYIYARQKTENTASNISLILAKQSRLTVEDIQMLVNAIPTMMSPIAVSQNDYAISITSIQRDKPGTGSYDKPYVFWQINNGLRSLITKQVFNYVANGSKQDNEVKGNFLRGYSFQEGDQIIHVMIAVKYYPIITGYYAPTAAATMENDMFTRPRKGAFQFAPNEIQ